MGKPKRASPGRSRAYLTIIEVPFQISVEENDERIKRLSEEIWDCISNRSRPKKRGDGSIDEFLSEKIESQLKL
jgi:hypothetical protein